MSLEMNDARQGEGHGSRVGSLASTQPEQIAAVRGEVEVVPLTARGSGVRLGLRKLTPPRTRSSVVGPNPQSPLTNPQSLFRWIKDWVKRKISYQESDIPLLASPPDDEPGWLERWWLRQGKGMRAQVDANCRVIAILDSEGR